MTRTRSEYRLSPIRVSSPAVALETVRPSEVHREALAALMLDAYQGTTDDEGEDLDDARDAIDQYLGSILRPHSFVAIDNDVPVAFAFVIVGDVHYIDPVVVASARKRHGLGSAVVRVCLRSLSHAGVSEVGATITDGNMASERLFAAVGFTRHGPWP